MLRVLTVLNSRSLCLDDFFFWESGRAEGFHHLMLKADHVGPSDSFTSAQPNPSEFYLGLGPALYSACHQNRVSRV